MRKMLWHQCLNGVAIYVEYNHMHYATIIWSAACILVTVVTMWQQLWRVPSSAERFVSASVSDPDSRGLLDPDSESGSRGLKKGQKC